MIRVGRSAGTVRVAQVAVRTVQGLGLRVWPGQAPPLDALEAELAEALKVVDPTSAAWRVPITLETEKKDVTVVRSR